MAELADARDSKSRILWMWGFDSPSGYQMIVRINLTYKIIVTAFIITIVYLYVSRNIYGETFVSEIRLADRNNTLIELSNQELIQLGKEICLSSTTWENLQASNKDISKKIMEKLYTEKDAIRIVESNSILTFLRYQSIYELCPENIYILSKLIKQQQDSD